MDMVFCVGCGKEIHKTAPSCPQCGAPQVNASMAGRNEKSVNLSSAWERKFELIEKAGGVKLKNINNLSMKEKLSINFNILSALFGPIYYIIKGMPKKALSLFGVTFALVVVITVIVSVLGLSESILNVTNFISLAVFGTRANIDFYKKIKNNDNGWW